MAFFHVLLHVFHVAISSGAGVERAANASVPCSDYRFDYADPNTKTVIEMPCIDVCPPTTEDIDFCLRNCPGQ